MQMQGQSPLSSREHTHQSFISSSSCQLVAQMNPLQISSPFPCLCDYLFWYTRVSTSSYFNCNIKSPDALDFLSHRCNHNSQFAISN